MNLGMIRLSIKIASSLTLFFLLALTLFRSGGILPEYIYNFANYIQIILVVGFYILYYLGCTKDTQIKINLFELLIILSLIIVFMGKSLVYGLAHSIVFITLILYLGFVALTPPKLLKVSVRNSFRYLSVFCTCALTYWHFYGKEQFFINPNGVASFALSLSLFTHLILKPSWLRAFLLFSQFILILSTNSRAGIIAVSLFYGLMFLSKWRWTWKNIGYLILCIMFLAVVYHYYQFLFGEEIRIITRGLDTTGHLSLGRAAYWETIYYDITANISNILFGLKKELEYSFGIHSAYIEIIARFGFVSVFLLFISQLHTLLIRLRGNARQDFFIYSLPLLLIGLVESNGLFTVTAQGVFLIIIFWFVNSQYSYNVESVK